MKATKETKVILELSWDEAFLLRALAPNIDYSAIVRIGAANDIALKGAKLFSDINKVLTEAKL